MSYYYRKKINPTPYTELRNHKTTLQLQQVTFIVRRRIKNNKINCPP